jgi:hypothetical protein
MESSDLYLSAYVFPTRCWYCAVAVWKKEKNKKENKKHIRFTIKLLWGVVQNKEAKRLKKVFLFKNYIQIHKSLTYKA